MPDTLTRWPDTSTTELCPNVPNTGTYIRYNDTFSFMVDIAGNIGRATIYIRGYFVTAL